MKRIRELEGANAVLEKQLQEREQKEAVPPTAMYSEMSVSIMEEKHRKAIAVLEREIKSLN